MLAFPQAFLHKTHQGKPFWLSRDEIDIGLYAEALATVFRFLPEEESLPIFTACLEPERSDAVKIAVARAGSMLALEVRMLSVMCRHDIDKYYRRLVYLGKNLFQIGLRQHPVESEISIR
jgi:hypothetical protein